MSSEDPKPALPPGYHMWFGIKMLLVLHIFVVGFLLTTPSGDDAKLRRWMGGIVYSGLAVILISSWLRWMFLRRQRWQRRPFNSMNIFRKEQ